MFVMATTAMQTFRDVQHDESVLSHAQQFKNMVAQFGSAAGTAASTLMLQWRATVHYNVINVRFAADDNLYRHSVDAVARALALQGAGPQSEPMAVAHLAQVLGQQSMLLACLDYFGVIAAVGLVGAALMLAQRVMR
jgi:hypothetical protein